MKKRSYYLRSKAFRTYLCSYIGITFIMIGLLGVVAARHIVENARAEELRIVENRLYTIAEDMENQIEGMRQTALQIAHLPIFRSDYFQTNKYYEIELLERLEPYKQNSEICEQYFIKYNEIDKIFASTGNVVFFQSYYNKKIGEEGFEEVDELIRSTAVEASETSVFYKQGDIMLFIYPLKKYAVSKIGREGVVCFLVSEKNIQERIERIAGKLNGEVTIYYKNACILGEANDLYEDVIEKESLNGNFRIRLYMGEDNYCSWNSMFSTDEVIGFSGIMVALLVLGFIVAYLNFRPLQQIANKYKTTDKELVEADWKSIDALIESLLHGKEKNEEILRQQYRMFKEHIIRLIASGEYSNRVQEQMIVLGINLEASVYGIIKCHFKAAQEIFMKYEGIYKDIEKLSDEGVSVLPYWDSDVELGVLVAVEEEYQMEEVKELLCSLVETKYQYTEIEIAGVFCDLKEINQDVRTKKQDNIIAENAVRKEDTCKVAGNLVAKKAVEYIEANFTDCELSLDQISSEFQVTSTYMSRILKQQIGMNYKEYLNGLRLEKAKELLENQEFSVTDVCFMSGYSSVSYFIKSFQKFTGMTPAKYREEWCRRGK